MRLFAKLFWTLVRDTDLWGFPVAEMIARNYVTFMRFPLCLYYMLYF